MLNLSPSSGRKEETGKKGGSLLFILCAFLAALQGGREKIRLEEKKKGCRLVLSVSRWREKRERGGGKEEVSRCRCDSATAKAVRGE